MAAVHEAVSETASELCAIVPKPRDYSHLKPYHFKAGVKPPANSGRPKGSKSFSTILVEAAPKLGKAYLREALKGSAPLLQDTRKIFMPIDSDADRAASENRGPTVIVFLNEGEVLPALTTQKPVITVESPSRIDSSASPTLLPSLQQSQAEPI